MARIRSNRILPLLVGIVLVLTLVVVVKSCTLGEEGDWVMKAVPVAPKPDADTPADTINTLTANVSAMTAEVAALRQESIALKQENRHLLNDRQHIEESVTTRLQQSLQERAQQRDVIRRQDASIIDALTARVDALSHNLSQKPIRTLSDQRPDRANPESVTEMPVGLGLDGLHRFENGSDELVWIDPLEQVLDTSTPGNGLLHRVGRTTDRMLDNTRTKKEALLTASSKVLDAAIPVFTIPRNATLMGSVAMTALVGRVPVKGQVRDPMPFKVITGKDNLAANGLSVPGVQGMIWSGTAIGDWTLSCVSGQLVSVTFVFDDGTIQTLSSDDRRLSGVAGNQNKPLGWISDTRGIPCVSGTRKTNAPAFLSQRIGVMAIDAAAQAAAQAETTTLINDAGASSSTVSGNSGQYVVGKTLSGGSQEIAKWLLERQAQSFDAVFVPAGIELAIHVDLELPIDFHSNGRKLQHAHSYGPNQRTASVTDLD